MNKLKLIVLFILFIFNSVTFGDDNFCRDRSDKQFVKEHLLNMENRVSFRNHGGLFNAGVCWWHSRLNRNAAYLAKFSPDKKRPSPKELKKLIKSLKRGINVVEVPGYKNLRELTKLNYRIVQKELDKWQLTDGIFRNAWLKGIWGTYKSHKKLVKIMMDKLYKRVHHKNQLVFQVLQFKGLDAHAWLVVNMERTSSGYILEVIDSNYNDPQLVEYTYGMKYFRYPNGVKYLPYTQFSTELKILSSRVKSYCKNQ